MNITKRIEAEIRQVMDDYWGSYLNGDLPTWASYLPDDYKNIGTTKAEIWNSKKEIVDFTKTVLDQTVGMAETRHKKTQIIPYAPYFMVHELGDLYVKAEEGWVFYAPFRLSSLLEKTADGWKILHQHGSYPDAKADEGEAFAFSELKIENKKLRDAIQARTVELERKNRELEIEAALERVRAKTMAMHRSDELGTTSLLLFDELKALGEISEQISIGIFDEENQVLNLYATLQGEQWKEATKVDLNEPHAMRKIHAGWQQQKKSLLIDLSGEELKAYNRFRSQYSNLKFPKERWVIHCAFFSKGVLSFSTTTPHDEQTMQLLERFAQVFDGTYTRFLDLQTAEAQTREAQIEAALERVRAQTMAMHNSEDVGKCTVKMFSEVTALGVDEGTRFGIGILNHENENNQLWTASKDGEEVNMHIGNLDMTLHPLLRSARKAWEKKASLHTYILEGEDLRNYYQVLNDAPDYPLRIAMENLPEKQFHYGFVFDHGFFYAFSPREFDPELIRIVHRFSALFGQTYRRYLDLKKAEEQAWEAQIEAALERVRSRAMAMRHSEELSEAAELLYNEFLKLGVESFSCGYLINDDEKREWQIWLTNPGEPFFKEFWTAPFDGDHHLKARYDSWKNKQDFHCAVLEGEENRAHHIVIAKYAPWKAEMLDSLPYRLVINSAHFSLGHLLVITPDRLAPELEQAMVRFANVFDMTYHRFLDLQRAEAQAREAQIEAALERVRSRSLAMHKTDELGEVITVVFERLKDLGFPVEEGIALITFTEGSQDMMEWMYNPDFAAAMKFHLPYFDHPVLANFWQAKNKGDDFLVKRYSAEESRSFHNHIFSYTDYRDTPEEVKAASLAAETYSTSIAIQKNTAIFINDYSGITLSENEVDILKRFSRVFEQAYIRFLDLQKAEAQAREAQIEAALERIRAQSMMMQHSDELNTTSHVFHEQLLLLGLPSEFSYVWLPDEANGTHMFWATWSESKNGTLNSRSKAITYPLDKTEPYTAACFEMWESDEDVFVNPIQPEEVEGFFATWSELVGDAENLQAENFPDGLYYAEAYMKYGCFGINIRRPLDVAEQEVLRRFANEFERTYTRFLDLQKAEEQARKIKLVNEENERLLHSILPQPIAEEIRTGRHNVVKRFEQVSILFADIVGFTVLSEKLKPGEVVDILNGLFSKFDDLTDQYGLEKIKTIGDAYMVAAGVPEENPDHAMTMFRFAQDMLRSIEEYNQDNNSQMQIRIGISSGPVIAGVIGKKKFAYDLWGDSVNTAARMEAYGREGKIQVSPTSYELLKNNFDFEKIPAVHIKGKGVMDVYVWKI